MDVLHSGTISDEGNGPKLLGSESYGVNLKANETYHARLAHLGIIPASTSVTFNVEYAQRVSRSSGKLCRSKSAGCVRFSAMRLQQLAARAADFRGARCLEIPEWLPVSAICSLLHR